MKKYLVMVLVALTLASCGRDNYNSTVVTNPTVVNESIINKFEAVTTGINGVQTLDFRSITLATQTPFFFSCTGSYGNSGNVGGVSQGNYVVYGSNSNGFIQVGHLQYYNDAGPNAQVCRDMTKERYTYDIIGTTLTVCMVNYPYCSEYEVVKP